MNPDLNSPCGAAPGSSEAHGNPVKDPSEFTAEPAKIKALQEEVELLKAQALQFLTRAEESEALVQAMRATRGWRLLEKYRLARRFPKETLALAKEKGPVQAIKQTVARVWVPSPAAPPASPSSIAAQRPDLSPEHREPATADDAYRLWCSLDSLNRRPLISVVMPVHNTSREFLFRAVHSVQTQAYPYWELCIADDASAVLHVPSMLQAFSRQDGRIRWVRRTENGGISAATNAALALAQGEYVAFLDHDDELTPDALLEVARTLDACPSADVVYSDQDKIDTRGAAFESLFKPNWSLEYFRGVMYIGHLLVVRRSLLEQVGGPDPAFDGVQDYELMLRISEHTSKILHIPKILYHWRAIPGSVALSPEAKSNIPKLQAEAVNAHLRRCGLNGLAKPHPDYTHRAIVCPAPREDFPRVSIVIPTKDAPGHHESCLKSLFERSSYPNIEVILVDCGTTDPRAKALFTRFPVSVLTLEGPFNYSKANNLAVARCQGPFVIFLNNDTEVVTEDWIQHLLFYAEQPGIGAAGPLLTYPSGTVQHAGVVLGLRGTADHIMRGFPSTGDGYAGSLSCAREVSCLTAACLMLKTETFRKVGGFCEFFGTHYQDVDLCLKIGALGQRLVYTPRAVLIHHESATRGSQYDLLDRALLIDTWQDAIEKGDPYFNPNFSLAHTNYTVQAGAAAP